MIQRNNARIWISLFAFVLVASFVRESEARPKPERVFRGKIIVSAKPFPKYAKSANAYIKKVRKQARKRFREHPGTQTWKIYYGAFFYQPLNDLEVTVKLYDITDGTKLLKESYQQYLGARGQGSVVSHITLRRSKYGVNRRILMTLENRRKVFASGQFGITGKVRKSGGTVDFTTK